MSERGGGFQKVLNLLGRSIPGTGFKTWVYLNLILAPRRLLYDVSSGFYRMDHVYEVLREFKHGFDGRFSILEFGVADGYAYTKMLYATKYLKMSDRVVVHGFDTFEGLPPGDAEADRGLLSGLEWERGTYKGRYEVLERHCRQHYANFRLHRGLFETTIDDELLQELLIDKPILIWIDCDLYSSTRSIFERIIPYIPTGCVIYFDDIYFNYSSRFTGEMRAVHEINRGNFGSGIELVLDRRLSWSSNRIYRFINLYGRTQHQLRIPQTDQIRFRGDDSPFP